MLLDKIKDYRIILASQSPRRQFLMKELGLNYEIILKEGIEEVYPSNLKGEEIAIYLAELKAKAYTEEVKEKTILITADTIVWINNEVLGKPTDRADAVRILKLLSGNKHEVITGVCLKTLNKSHTFTSLSSVFFKPLSDVEINYYLDNFKPYDKAGAYGIQEWIGYVAIERIEGSYFNVMGLPIQKLYVELEKFI